MELNDFKPNMRGTIHLLLTGLEEKTDRNGKKFLLLTLTDGKSEIRANQWDTNLEKFEFTVGQVLNVSLETKDYRGNIFFTAVECKGTFENPDKYVLSAPLSSEKMYNDIVSFAGTLGNYSQLVQSILCDHKEALMYWTAAKKIHHNIRGGLLYHLYRMLQAAVKLTFVYKSLDKELLCAGVILHDIGKLKELKCNQIGGTEYTVDGSLFGHSFLGAEMIKEYADKTALDENKVKLIQHLIISHHGTIEMGAIKLPAIPEATVLFYLDSMDTAIYQYETAREGMQPGTMSEMVYGLGNRVYLP